METLTINVGPGGQVADADSLESWLGLAPNGLNMEFDPLRSVFAGGGAAVLFPSFSSNPGDALEFEWDGLFELEVDGYLFYLLDDVLTVLDYNVFLIATTDDNTPPTDLVSFSNSITAPLSPGNHTLAFGVVVGNSAPVVCAPEEIFCPQPIPDLLDPVLTVSNLGVGPTAVPEPGTVALMGLGLLGLAALRRKRS